MQARPYQKECIETINALDSGSYIVKMATGLGKSFCFTHIKRKGRVLVLAHREELIRQPIKYYDCPVGIEMAKDRSNGEEVVIASVQSLARRLDDFSPNAFDTIITDECHHSASKTYRKIYDYFNSRLHVGFTATVNRSDGVRLDDVFQEIIFQRDLKWGIQNGYLSDIYCRRANIGYDLSKVHTRMGDYAPGELERAMDGTADAIAETYKKLAVGATLIFAVSVEQAEEIAKRIPGAVTVTGETKNRNEIIQRFTEGKISCIVNVMVFTEGTDIPRVETVIIARPTQSDSLYAQMVGRGIRLYPGKEKLNLIDCVGVAGRANLCTAPSLLGIDLTNVPAEKREQLEGDLFDLPDQIVTASDCPQSWIKNIQIVDLWAQEQSYNLHGINFFRMPDGAMVCNLPGKNRIEISRQDEIGRVHYKGELLPMQDAIDRVFADLRKSHQEYEYIWNLDRAKGWGKFPASEKQLALIQRRCKGFDPAGITKMQASQILNRIMVPRRTA